MRRPQLFRLAWGLFLAVLIGVAQTELARGQFTQNRDTIKVDSSGFPPDVQKGYRLFRTKCSECHGLDTSLKMTLSPAGWNSEVKRMQAMPSSQFNDKQAAAILDFLNYDEAHRKSQGETTTQPPPSDPVAAGSAFYYAQSCDACHSIGGKGGDAGPPLDDVGKRLSREQLTKRMQDRRAGAAMPPLPSETTDEQIHNLVEFLLTLKGR